MKTKTIDNSMWLIIVTTAYLSVAAASQVNIAKLEEQLERDKIERAFTEAIIKSDWNKAIMCCSDRVREASKPYRTKENFFKETVPVLHIQAKRKFEKNQFSSVIVINGKVKKEEGEHLSIHLSQGCSITIKWTAKLMKINGKWRIDFEPLELSDQCAIVLDPLNKFKRNPNMSLQQTL